MAHPRRAFLRKAFPIALALSLAGLATSCATVRSATMGLANDVPTSGTAPQLSDGEFVGVPLAHIEAELREPSGGPWRMLAFFLPT